MERIIIVTLLVLGFATPAHAYLDPGTGSMLLSLIVGVVASAWFAFKGFFYKIKNYSHKNYSTEVYFIVIPAEAGIQ